jgi:multiple sugar transport system permease protein
MLFNVFPLLYSLGISFTEFNPIIDQDPLYVGFENYLNLLRDPRGEVWAAFSRTAALVVVTVGAQALIGLGIAMLLRAQFPGRSTFVAILLIPMMLSPAIMGSFWRYLFNADYGLINWIFDSRWAWSGSSPRAFWAVAIAEIWMWTPFMTLISLAALNGIPPSLYEAAEVDRASRWFKFRHITLPLVMPLAGLGMVFRAMDTFKVFDTAMVQNGNLEGQPTTFVSVLLHARGFGGSFSLGEPTALAYLMLLVAMALTTLALRVLNRVGKRRV